MKKFTALSALRGHVHLYKDDTFKKITDVLDVVSLAIVENEYDESDFRILVTDGAVVLTLNEVVGDDQRWELFVDATSCARCVVEGFRN